MAFQTRHRDPLFDSDTQAIIERRGKELVGLTMIGLAFLVALMLGSYSPDDPNWLNATDAPASNILGPVGAAIASPLYVIAGYGSWAIAAIFGVWGLRFLFHYGEERAMSRLIFAPIGVALIAIYASTHLPGANWVHSFGLGGLFGDTVLGAILGVLPVNPGAGLKVMALVLFGGAIAMSAFVLGFSRDELWAYTRYLVGGIILLYATAMTALGRGAVGGLRMAADARTRAAERRATTEAPAVVDQSDVSPAVLRATRAYREGT
ncbi:MAG: DNA translocase FtsK, partial [Boseongicola sp.]|nr:DNA translocase FtsK [Boseongicola sp.]